MVTQWNVYIDYIVYDQKFQNHSTRKNTVRSLQGQSYRHIVIGQEVSKSEAKQSEAGA